MTTIRTARTYDAPMLADLCGQLGYPASRQQIVARLAAIEAMPSNCVLVAEDGNGQIVAWLHVAQSASLAVDTESEILGLVVDENARSAGIGAALVEAAEAWVRAHGGSQLRVRSRIERERAHRFYERAGFQRIKTQVMLRKVLADETDSRA
jgi:GNAT superfamily N-acetyltransferase